MTELPNIFDFTTPRDVIALIKLYRKHGRVHVYDLKHPKNNNSKYYIDKITSFQLNFKEVEKKFSGTMRNPKQYTRIVSRRAAELDEKPHVWLGDGGRAYIISKSPWKLLDI